MRNKKLILLSLVAVLVLAVASGCGSGGNKTSSPAPSAPAKTAASMPNEDPDPIAQDLERKLKDTSGKVKGGKWAEAKIIAAEAIKTNERLIVHITDARLKEHLQKSVKAVNEAVNMSPANPKASEDKITTALEALKQASIQLQGHKH